MTGSGEAKQWTNPAPVSRSLLSCPRWSRLQPLVTHVRHCSGPGHPSHWPWYTGGTIIHTHHWSGYLNTVNHPLSGHPCPPLLPHQPLSSWDWKYCCEGGEERLDTLLLQCPLDNWSILVQWLNLKTITWLSIIFPLLNIIYNHLILTSARKCNTFELEHYHQISSEPENCFKLQHLGPKFFPQPPANSRHAWQTKVHF